MIWLYFTWTTEKLFPQSLVKFQTVVDRNRSRFDCPILRIVANRLPQSFGIMPTRFEYVSGNPLSFQALSSPPESVPLRCHSGHSHADSEFPILLQILIDSPSFADEQHGIGTGSVPGVEGAAGTFADANANGLNLDH